MDADADADADADEEETSEEEEAETESEDTALLQVSAGATAKAADDIENCEVCTYIVANKEQHQSYLCRGLAAESQQKVVRPLCSALRCRIFCSAPAHTSLTLPMRVLPCDCCAYPRPLRYWLLPIDCVRL
jgi:hypothetical protein